MLRASRRVLRPGGRLAFTTIEVAADLPPRDRRQAREAGPRAVATRRDYPCLLRSAGFVDVEARDATDGYLATVRGWLERSLPHLDALRELDGREVVDERVSRWRQGIAAIEAGWLRRRIYAARRPA